MLPHIEIVHMYLKKKLAFSFKARRAKKKLIERTHFNLFIKAQMGSIHEKKAKNLVTLPL